MAESEKMKMSKLLSVKGIRITNRHVFFYQQDAIFSQFYQFKGAVTLFTVDDQGYHSTEQYLPTEISSICLEFSLEMDDGW